jgi:3-hydroxy-9,10-secoandrosta-1,3,5(10)-triene-9,17-dione monooxygenase
MAGGDAGLIATAREVATRAAEHAVAAEQERRLPQAAVDELVSSGLVRLLRPRRLGGHEADPVTYVEVGRELAYGFPALGWVYGVLSIHEWYMAYANPELQDEVWGSDADALIVDSLAPVGTAEATEGGFRVSGRWKFVSGVDAATWVTVSALIVLPDGGQPEPCLFFIPRADCQVIDEWHVVGMRGTGSQTVLVEDAVVPAHRMMPFARLAGSGRAQHEMLDDGPLYRMPWTPMLAAAIFPAVLGTAQRAIDEFRAWTKQRVRPFEMGAQAREAPAAQFALAEAATRWDAAHTLARRYAEELYQFGGEGRTTVDDDERARFFAWRAFVGRTAAEVTERLFLEAGANALYETSPLQQTWRDAHAASQHVSLLYGDAMTSYGRIQMGLPGHPLL